MKSSNKKQEKSYGIIGLGRFGSALAMHLAENGKEIMVIDSDEDHVRALRDYTENAFVVRNLDKKTLEETGIQNCDVVVVCIGEKVDVSILTTLQLTSLGVPRVIAKANTAEQGEILERLGAEVVYPERYTATCLARRLSSSFVLNYLELSEKIDISEILLPDEYIGKSIAQINLRGRYGLNIIAIENGGSITTDIQPSYVFTQGDRIYVVGPTDNLLKFESTF